MGYMNFKEPSLEKLFKNFKWTRNNTIQLFEEAQKDSILDYRSQTEKSTKYTFQPLLFQFQCIITTTDTYYRKLTKDNNQNFGVLVKNDKITPKKEIPTNNVKKLLQEQLVQLENLLREFNSKQMEEEIDIFLAISNHEYLHQGQMVIDFREAGVELPERYKIAWAL